MRSYISRNTVLLLTLPFGLALACSSGHPTPEKVGTSESQALTSGPGMTGFQKHGNNGTVSCDTFCNGGQWGATGTCIGSEINDLPCDQSVGLLTNGAEQQCTCSANGQTFIKDGDNGTASCDTFCAGPQWGQVGSCVSARLSTPVTVPAAGGGAVSYDGDCNVNPGFIENATEMTCVCAQQSVPFTVDESSAAMRIPASSQSNAAGIASWSVAVPAGNTMTITSLDGGGNVNHTISITLPTSSYTPASIALDGTVLVAGTPSGLSTFDVSQGAADIFNLLGNDLGTVDVAQLTSCEWKAIFGTAVFVTSSVLAVADLIACPVTGLSCALVVFIPWFATSLDYAFGLSTSSCPPNTWGTGVEPPPGQSCNTSTCASTCADSCGNPGPCNGFACPTEDPCTGGYATGTCGNGGCVYSGICWGGGDDDDGDDDDEYRDQARRAAGTSLASTHHPR